MNKYSHSEIVDYVAKLSGELSRNSNPESVLLKYAKDNNLPSSVLQKMAQVYNTAKTLNYMEKSASRGESFKVIDTESLISEYEKTDDLPIESSIAKEASNNESYATIECRSMFEVVEEEDITKSASSYEQYENPKTLFSEDDDNKLHDTILEEIISEQNTIVRNAIEKLAAESTNLYDFNFPELERQIITKYGSEALPLVDSVVTVIEKDYNKQITRCDLTKVKSAFIRKEHYLLNIFDTIVEAKSLIKEASTATGERQKNKKYKGNKDERFKIPEYKPKSYNNQSQTPSNNVSKKPDGKTSFKDDVSEIAKDISDFAIGKNKTNGILTEIGNYASEHITDPLYENFKNTLMPNNNALQMAIDNAELEEKQNMAFSNLMLTDPVLQDADEDTMTEVFETIRELSPFIASNPVRLRSVLREASQFDSVSPYVLQTLIDFELKKTKTESEKSEITKNKYKLPTF